MSEIRANTISDAAGTGPVTLTKQSAAKAWDRYNQLSPSISQSFNISSVTDSGTGDAYHNYTNALSGTDFPAVATNSFSATDFGLYVHQNAAGYCRTLTYNNSSVSVDRHMNVVQMGDLA